MRTATVLLAGLLLAAIPVLGPGYGPQYAYWYVRRCSRATLLLDDGWRRILRAFYAVAAVTYVVEYALLIALGAASSLRSFRRICVPERAERPAFDARRTRRS